MQRIPVGAYSPFNPPRDRSVYGGSVCRLHQRQTFSGIDALTGGLGIHDGKVIFAEAAGTRQTADVLLKFAYLDLTNGKLDITNHDLVTADADYNWIETLLLAGQGLTTTGGTPDSDAPAILSSDSISNGNTILVPVAADTWMGGTTSWDGVSVSGSGSVIIKYTYFGDLNLDGQVDGSDEGLIAGNLHSTTPGLADFATSYLMGDLNFDGAVDGNDYFPVNGAQNIVMTITGTDAEAYGIAGTVLLEWTPSLDLWQGFRDSGGGGWVYGSSDALSIEAWNGIDFTGESEDTFSLSTGHFSGIGFHYWPSGAPDWVSIDATASGDFVSSSFCWNGVAQGNNSGLGVADAL